MSKLLPCPFCGSDARMWPSHTKADEDGSYEIVGCSNVECLIEPTTEEYLPYDEALKRWNTRAAPARCDELKTVGHLWEYAEYYRDDRGWYGYVKVITEENPAHHVSPIEKVRHHDELVTRQNAEEVIAAKDARIRELERRLKEVELEHTGVRNSYFAERRKASALEADNKRLREALEDISRGETTTYDEDVGTDVSTWLDEEEMQSIARAALGEVKP